MPEPILSTACLRCYIEIAESERLKKKEHAEKKRVQRRKRADARRLLKNSNAVQTAEFDKIAAATPSKVSDACSRVTAEAKAVIEEVGGSWFNRMLVFDVETKKDAQSSQALKCGYYQIRGLPYDADPDNKARQDGDNTIVGHALQGTLTREKLDRLQRHGFFYDPDHCTDKEIATIKRFVKHWNNTVEKFTRYRNRNVSWDSGSVQQNDAQPQLPWLTFMHRNEFVETVLLRQEYASWEHKKRDRIMWIGHNISFDIGSLARHTGVSRGHSYGGLTMKLCACDGSTPHSCIKHPNIIMKKLGPSKFSYKASYRYSNIQYDEPTGEPVDSESPIQVLDTMTFAKALLGPGQGASLKTLGKDLSIKHKKIEDIEHDEITPKYLRYNMRDVQATFEVFQKLRDLYSKHDIARPIASIYSGASLGKGYLEKLGVKPFLNTHPDFDKSVFGIEMESYFGGRSNVMLRKEVREVIYADFKSQYPTVNGLLNNQSILIAEKIVVRRNDPDTLAFLKSITLETLLDRTTWPKLRGWVLVNPDGDMLPFRTTYNSEDMSTFNISRSVIKNGPPIWYTLADVADSILATGKCPSIFETVELVPHGKQATFPLKIFGEDEYVIDLNREDFFIRLINLRANIKKKAKDARTYPAEQRTLLKQISEAIKIIANSASYGILVEVTVDERKETTSIDVNYGDKATRRRARGELFTEEDGKYVRSGVKVEQAGKFFGPAGSFIPAGGRLLLGMVERAANDAGIRLAACDTDSAVFARPDGWTRARFQQTVKNICAKFQSLNPYSSEDPLLVIDDVNMLDGKSELEALYFLGISAKRYVLANISGSPNIGNIPISMQPEDIIIRKATAHGAAHIEIPHGHVYDPNIIDLTAPEHPSAIDKKTGKINYSSLINGAAPRLMLDLWRVAMLQHLAGCKNGMGRFIESHPQLSRIPQSTRLALNTGHLWKIYADGKTRLPNARPGLFLRTLPTPKIIGAKIDDIPGLYADNDQKLSYDLEDYRNQDGTLGGLYFRGTNEFPIALFGTQKYRLASISDTLRDYFDKPNHKMDDPEAIGYLHPRQVIVSGKVYSGKTTSPLASLGDDIASLNDDDDDFSQKDAAIDLILNAEILNGLDMQKLAARVCMRGVDISPASLKRIADGKRAASSQEAHAILKCLKVSRGQIELSPIVKSSAMKKIAEDVKRVGASNMGDGYKRLSELTGCSEKAFRIIAEGGQSIEAVVGLKGDAISVCEMIFDHDDTRVIVSKKALASAIRVISGAERREHRVAKFKDANVKRVTKYKQNEKIKQIGIDAASIPTFTPEELIAMWRPADHADAPTKAKRRAARQKIKDRQIECAARAHNSFSDLPKIDVRPYVYFPDMPTVETPDQGKNKFTPIGIIDGDMVMEVQNIRGDYTLASIDQAFELSIKWEARRAADRERKALTKAAAADATNAMF